MVVCFYILYYSAADFKPGGAKDYLMAFKNVLR